MRAEEREWRQQRRRREELDLMTAAAAWLRDRAYAESYAGFAEPERADALAATVDALARHWAEIPEPVRDAAVSAGWQMLGERNREARRGRPALQRSALTAPGVDSMTGPVTAAVPLAAPTVGGPAYRPRA